MRQALTGRKRVYGHLAAAMLSAVLLVFGCSQKGTGPTEIRRNVYIARDVLGYRTGIIDILDAGTMVHLDSIVVEARIQSMTPSPDGRWLYLTTEGPGSDFRLVKLNLLTKGAEITTEADDGLSGAAPVNHGRWLLHGRLILDAVSLTEIGRLPDTLRPRWPAGGGTKIPAEITYTNRFRLYDVTTGEYSGEYIPHLKQGLELAIGAAGAWLHPDERRLLVVVRGPWSGLAFFLIGDMMTGETLLQYPLTYPLGEVALSPDGSLAAVTDPGIPGIPEANTKMVDVFDLTNLTHVWRFHWLTGSDLESSARVAFLSDEGRILVGGWFEGPLHVLDIETRSIVLTIRERYEEVGVPDFDVAPAPN